MKILKYIVCVALVMGFMGVAVGAQASVTQVPPENAPCTYRGQLYKTCDAALAACEENLVINGSPFNMECVTQGTGYCFEDDLSNCDWRVHPGFIDAGQIIH